MTTCYFVLVLLLRGAKGGAHRAPLHDHTIQLPLLVITFSADRCLRLTSETQTRDFVRPEPLRSVSLGYSRDGSLGFTRDGSRNPLLGHSGGSVTVVAEASRDSNSILTTGFPTRPKRLYRSKRIYEEHGTSSKDEESQGRNLM